MLKGKVGTFLHKHKRAVYVVVIGLVVVWWLRGLQTPGSPACNSLFTGFAGKNGTYVIDHELYSVALAVSPEEMSKGLGGVTCLNESDAMLFVYSKADTYAFWMKDMKISIDMVWLDGAGKIVKIAGDVSPDTYPQNFAPENPALYVLETKAGVAHRHEWQVGEQILDVAGQQSPLPTGMP